MTLVGDWGFQACQRSAIHPPEACAALALVRQEELAALCKAPTWAERVTMLRDDPDEKRLNSLKLMLGKSQANPLCDRALGASLRMLLGAELNMRYLIECQVLEESFSVRSLHLPWIRELVEATEPLIALLGPASPFVLRLVFYLLRYDDDKERAAAMADRHALKCAAEMEPSYDLVLMLHIAAQAVYEAGKGAKDEAMQERAKAIFRRCFEIADRLFAENPGRDGEFRVLPWAPLLIFQECRVSASVVSICYAAGRSNSGSHPAGSWWSGNRSSARA
jgi:hypothetical protein